MQMYDNIERPQRAILISIDTGDYDAEASLEELKELMRSAGGETIATVSQKRDKPDSATCLGSGRLLEVKEFAQTNDIDLLVFDCELTPTQIRNLEAETDIRTIDRTMLILDIFALHAKTNEGKLQVELAQLKYRLPRLRGFGVEMSRTGAGIGTRGPGETRLESDRRHIRRRISALEEEIKELKKHRGLIRDRRKKDGVITAALVGYTNAGKSTLLNTLTDAQVFAEDKLFATLDPTSRAITLDDNRKILLVDTVGFIRKLPHHLIEAFKSTLEEAVVADVLLHVIDASGEEMDNQITVVEQVLSDIGAVGKPVVAVFNKCDRLEDYPITNLKSDKCVYISAKHRTNIDKLIEAIADTAPGKKQKIKACIPYSAGSLVNELHENQKVISEEYGENGTVMELMVDAKMYDKIREYIL